MITLKRNAFKPSIKIPGWILIPGFYGILLLLIFTNCTNLSRKEVVREATMAVDDQRLANAADYPGDWLSYGQTYAEDRYSRLDQITTENVDELGLAWYHDIGIRGGVEATPLVINGIMYLTGPWSIVYALDARNGDLIWKYDPEVPRMHGLKACCGVVNRGPALYKGKVYVGTLDGRLIALDAVNGKPVWSVATFDPETNYTITGAPRVVDGKVIIGNGGAEFGVRGYVAAYDAETGARVWKTYTVPGNPSQPFESEAMKKAAKTWSGEWWKPGGGGTVWDAIVYDPELDLLYVGTGNGSPWSHNMRSEGKGDNLFLASILALNPDNGKIQWHFQTTPGDSWDYTATQPIILADLEINGEMRKVLMQAPKNGFFYVLDRKTGEFISAENYVPMNWADGVDPETGRPNIQEEAIYGKDSAEVTPDFFGGHNWQPMAYNHQTNYVYFPVHIRSTVFADIPGNIKSIKAPGDVERRGYLKAWDPVKQKEKWRVPLSNLWNGGVLTTKNNLVFHGGGDGRFVAYNATTGEQLWEVSTGLGIIGSPVSYKVNGEQYITIVAGWGRVGAVTGNAANHQQIGKLFTFKINGKASMPDLIPRRNKAFIPDIDLPTDPEKVAQGEKLYGKYCGVCHKSWVNAFPNLLKSTQVTHENFEEIVLEGTREKLGMPFFADSLNTEQLKMIQGYIVSEAKKTLAKAEN